MTPNPLVPPSPKQIPYIIEYRIFGSTKNPRDIFIATTNHFDGQNGSRTLPHNNYARDGLLIANYLGPIDPLSGTTDQKWVVTFLGREAAVHAAYHALKALAHTECGIDSSFFGQATTYYRETEFDPTKFPSLRLAIEHLHGRSGNYQ